MVHSASIQYLTAFAGKFGGNAFFFAETGKLSRGTAVVLVDSAEV